MRDMALLALLFALAYAGFLLFALSQHRHWKAIVGTIAGRKPRRLRWGGGILLGLSLVTAFYRDGPAFGAILWVAVLMIAAGAAVATLTWRTPLLRRVVAGPVPTRRIQPADDDRKALPPRAGGRSGVEIDRVESQTVSTTPDTCKPERASLQISG